MIRLLESKYSGIQLWTSKVEDLLSSNGISFITSTYDDHSYIEIEDTYPNTRVVIKSYVWSSAGDVAYSVAIQEFDEYGKQIYSKEFANLGAAFLKRIKRNIG